MKTGKITRFRLLPMWEITLTLFLITGCMSDHPGTPNGGSTSDVFDFSTEKYLTLKVNYDVPEGYKVLFSVFTEDPREFNENGEYTLKAIKPIDRGCTDEQGNYQHRIKVPSMVQKLYVYTTQVGVPRILVAELNGTILEAKEIALDRSVTVKAAQDIFENTTYNQFKNNKSIHKLGSWMNVSNLDINGVRYNNVLGRPTYLLPNRINIPSSVLAGINQIVPEGKPLNPNINDYIVNGDIHIVKDANVDIYFVDEETGASSVFGYYCYKTDAPPATKEEILKNTVALFPNTKLIGRNGGLLRGDGVRLSYFEDGVNKGNVFPKGTSVGWVIYNNGYKAAQSGGMIDLGLGDFYSTYQFNAGGKKHMAMFRIDDFVVMGMDDWSTYTDYNDVLFCVHSNPIDAVTDVPEVKPEEPETTYDVEVSGTLAFEDLWPKQGDFDMNDVVVKYNSVVTFTDQNEVIKTVDNFEIVWSGAAIRNGFSYTIDNINRGDVNISFKGDAALGASVDQTQQQLVVHLFNDAIEATGQNTKTSKIEVTTRYNKLPKDRFVMAPYNSFIRTLSGKEVHLTNLKPTPAADRKWFGKESDLSDFTKGLYYITYVNEIQLPFAINVPAHPNPELNKPFIIAREGHRIDTYYPKFINWIQSKGQQDQDWYLHPSNP